MTISNDVAPRASFLSLRHVGAGAAVLALLSLALLAYGFLETGLDPRQAWSDKAGAMRFLIFAGAFAVLAIGAAGAGARRRLLVLGAAGGLWVLAAFGVGSVASVMLVGLACLAIGDFLFGPLWRARFGLTTAGLLSTCVGLSVLMLVMGLTAPWPIHSAASHATVLGFLVLAGHRRIRLYAAGTAAWAAQHRDAGLRDHAAFSLLILALAAQSVYAALPEQYHDALGVHLLVATTLAQQGSWTPDPAQFVGAAAPYGANWIFAVSYMLAGEGAAKFANFALLGLLCAMLGNAVAWRQGRALALLAAALLASTPLAFITTASLFSENALAVFCLAPVLLLVRSHREFGLRDGAALAFLLAGAALVKLHAVLFFIPFGLVFAALLLRHNAPRRALTILAFSAVLTAVLGCQPYLHAYLVTGNPVYPWFNAVFKSPYFDSSANFSDGNWIGKLSPALPYLWTFKSSLFMEGQDGALGFAVLGLLLPGLAMAVATRDRMALVAAAAGLGYVCMLVPVTQYMRYAYPALPLVLIVCASGLRAFAPGDGHPPHSSLARSSLAFGSLFVGLGLAFLPSAGWILPSFDANVVVGLRDRDSFISSRVPYRGLINAVNALAGRDARVLILGQPVGAGLASMPIYGVWYNPKVSQELANASSVDAAALVLHRNRITHVFWRPGAVPDKAPIARLLKQSGTPLASTGDAILYGVSIPAPNGANLLENSSFSDGLERWDNVGVSQQAQHGPITMPPGSRIAQAAVVEDTTLVYEASFLCGDDPATVGAQVNWLDSSGRIVDVVSRPETCTAPGRKASTIALTPPRSARTAFVYFHVIEGSPVVLEKLMLVKP